MADEQQYRIDVGGVGETRWSNNSLTFDSHDKAALYADDLLGRWTGGDIARVVTTDVPKHEPINLSDERIVVDYRRAS